MVAEDAVDGLSPARFLTKICIVSSASAEEAREEVLVMLEMLLERMLMVVLARSWIGRSMSSGSRCSV